VSEHETPAPAATPPAAPDALDALAVYLVGMDHQLRAISAGLTAALLCVQGLQMARGRAHAAPSPFGGSRGGPAAGATDPAAGYVTRAALGLDGAAPGVPEGPERAPPRTFMQGRTTSAAPPLDTTDTTRDQ
jgi:hypothetical protein